MSDDAAQIPADGPAADATVGATTADGAVVEAAQGKDANGDLWAALANTEWGKIPGYVRDNVCYFEYCGPRSTSDYTVVKGAILTDDANEVLPLGDENGEEIFCAVARTSNGTIPGKARIGYVGYAYDGQGVYEASSSFSYLGPRKTPLDVAAAEIKAKAKSLYDYGMGPASWYDACNKYFPEAAEMGYAPAQYALAYYRYYSNYTGQADDAEAVKYFGLAAEQNHKEAVYMYGYMYYNGRGVDRDLKKAKEIWSKPAAKFHSQAQSLLADIIRVEEERKHAEEVVNKAREAADGGDAAAQLQMARYYEYGTDVVPCDKAKGLEYLRLAADQGLASAQLYLAQSYDNALFDLSEDDAVALEWYRKAADQLDPAAAADIQAKRDELSAGNAELVTAKLDISDVERTLADLATMRERIGVLAARPDGGALGDAGAALERYTAEVTAALEEKRKEIPDLEAKIASAQAAVDSLQEGLESRELAAVKVGEFHEHGWGGAEQSSELAREYYRRSGSKGESGLLRLDEEDRIKAELQRLTEAADGGDADSQLQLGKTLEYGWLGAAVDIERAERLYRQAAEAGNSQAQYQLGLFVIKNSAKKFLQLAADQGHWDASSALSRINCYF